MDEIELLDVANDLLVINKTTIERLFQEESQNALILYLFYYKTAKWQKSNPIKASDDYCKKCLHWGTDKIQLAKKKLKEMNLIELIKKTNSKGIITGWYVKVNYLIDESRIPETTVPTEPQLVGQETNTYNNNNINTINNKNTKERFKAPTLEEVDQYIKEKNLNVNAKDFYDYFTDGNWIDSRGQKVHNWKLKVRTWSSYRKPKEEKTPDWFNKEPVEEEIDDETRRLIEEIEGTSTSSS